MRILHLDTGRGMRGGQWQALRLHQTLVERGCESLLLARPDSPLAAEVRKRNLPCAGLSAARLAVLSRRFDLVHAHDARGHTLAALWSRAPFVVSRRVAFPVRTSFLSRWKYRRPAMFLAVSRFVADILTVAGVPASKIAVVYDGVPVPASAASGDAILTPETPDPQKGMALALEAARIAGVRLTPTSDLERDLPGSLGLVYLSKSEGLGSGILLAMAHGVAVIASRTGGIPELIEDGVTGILAENDPHAVAACFARIDRRIGLAARQSVMDRFTVAHMADATQAAYAEALRHA